MSVYTLQEERDYASISRGSWFIRDEHTVVFMSPGCLESAYTKQGLKDAVATVKANRSSYVTQEAYEAMLQHFERGLGLFS